MEVILKALCFDVAQGQMNGTPNKMTGPHGTIEMMDLVYVIILANRRVKLQHISEQQGFSVGPTQKIVFDDQVFSKVNCSWVPKNVDAR